MHKQVSLQRHQMTQFYHEPSYTFCYVMVAQIRHGFPLSKGKGLLQRAPCPSPRGKASLQRAPLPLSKRQGLYSAHLVPPQGARPLQKRTFQERIATCFIPKSRATSTV